MAFYVEDTLNISTPRLWVRKSRDNGGKLDLNNQPPFRRPVTATLDLTSQDPEELTQENPRISHTYIAENSKIFSPSFNEILVGLV